MKLLYLYLPKTKVSFRKRVVILFSLVGMPIRKGLCLETNTGFILPILSLMMIRYSWMLSHQKIW